MSNIFIMGATGGVGHRLGPKLVKNGHKVTGLHRKKDQAEALKSKGITPVFGDLMDMTAADMAAAIEGADVVVFSAGAAGSGRDKATAIDGEAPEKLIAAAQQTGLKRIYMVSVIMDAGRRADTTDDFEHYMAMKRRADVALAQSGLDYVILRPGTLKDEDGNARVQLGRAVTYGDVARGNVAATLAELIDTPQLKRDVLELTNGDVSVARAVKGLLRG